MMPPAARRFREEYDADSTVHVAFCISLKSPTNFADIFATSHLLLSTTGSASDGDLFAALRVYPCLPLSGRRRPTPRKYRLTANTERDSGEVSVCQAKQKESWVQTREDVSERRNRWRKFPKRGAEDREGSTEL